MANEAFDPYSVDTSEAAGFTSTIRRQKPTGAGPDLSGPVDFTPDEEAIAFTPDAPATPTGASDEIAFTPDSAAPAPSTASSKNKSGSYGYREDGTEKQNGFLGPLQRPDGKVSTELSTSVEVDGKDVSMPLLVPTLSQEEITHLLDNGKPTPEIIQKAVKHAMERKAAGKSPFADNSESPLPVYENTDAIPKPVMSAEAYDKGVRRAALDKKQNAAEAEASQTPDEAGAAGVAHGVESTADMGTQVATSVLKGLGLTKGPAAIVGTPLQAAVNEVQKAVDVLKGSPDFQERANTLFEKSSEANPQAFSLGNQAGAMAPFLMAGAGEAKFSSWLGTAKAATTGAAGMGVINSVLRTANGDPTTAADIMSDMVIGGIFGAVHGGNGPSLSERKAINAQLLETFKAHLKDYESQTPTSPEAVPPPTESGAAPESGGAASPSEGQPGREPAASDAVTFTPDSNGNSADQGQGVQQQGSVPAGSSAGSVQLNGGRVGPTGASGEPVAADLTNSSKSSTSINYEDPITGTTSSIPDGTSTQDVEANPTSSMRTDEGRPRRISQAPLTVQIDSRAESAYFHDALDVYKRGNDTPLEELWLFGKRYGDIKGISAPDPATATEHELVSYFEKVGAALQDDSDSHGSKALEWIGAGSESSALVDKAKGVVYKISPVVDGQVGIQYHPLVLSDGKIALNTTKLPSSAENFADALKLGQQLPGHLKTEIQGVSETGALITKQPYLERTGEDHVTQKNIEKWAADNNFIRVNGSVLSARLDSSVARSMYIGRAADGSVVLMTDAVPRNFSIAADGKVLAMDLGHTRLTEEQVAKIPEAKNLPPREEPPMSVGPGAASAEEMLADPRPQIQQLAEAVREGNTQRDTQLANLKAELNTTEIGTLKYNAIRAQIKALKPIDPEKTPIVEKWKQLYGNAQAKAMVLLSRGAEETREAYAQMFKKPTETAWKAVLGEYQLRRGEQGYWAREMTKEFNKAVPDKLRRKAIVNFIEAGEDTSLLQQRADSFPKGSELNKQYTVATQLTPAEKVLARQVGSYYHGVLDHLVASGGLNDGVENYISHFWKTENPVTRQLQGDIDRGLFKKNPDLLKKRIFESFYEGEKLGYEPTTKDPGLIVAAYDQHFSKAIEARRMVQNLATKKAADGKPLLYGSGTAVKDPKYVPGPNHIQLPEVSAQDGKNYIKVSGTDILKDWEWHSIDETGASPMKGDLYVHPEVAKKLQTALAVSTLRKSPVFGPMLRIQSEAKMAMMMASHFHFVQESIHGLGHGVYNPMKVNRFKFDFNDPDQAGLMSNGGQFINYDAAQQAFHDGLASGGVIAKMLPEGAAKHVIGYQEWLFQDYIPKLKMTMALEALKRNRARYGPILDSNGVQTGKAVLTPGQIFQVTAAQANAAFGELNYQWMGRSAEMQDTLRLALLAPDFLEARARFVGQALLPQGREQLMALGKLTVGSFVLARVLNVMSTGNMQLNHPFSVLYNGKEYSLRSVPADVWHMLSDPGNFFYYRTSPIAQRGMDLMYQRDYNGRPIAWSGQFENIVGSFLPIMGKTAVLNAIHGNIRQLPSDMWKSGLESIGFKVKDYTASIEMADLARKFNKATGKDKGDAVYPTSQYHELRLLLRNDDLHGAAKEYKRLLGTGKVDRARVISTFAQAATKPMTGSGAQENAFKKAMSAYELNRYNEARAEQREMNQKLLKVINALDRDKY